MSVSGIQLDLMLQQLQNLSYNNGGSFKFFTINNAEGFEPFHAIRNFLGNEFEFKMRYHPDFKPPADKFERLQKDVENLRLLILDDWEITTAEKLDWWLNFKGPFKELIVDEMKLKETTLQFLKTLKEYLLENKLVTSYMIDEHFDDYNTPWGDQMSCDIVYEVKDKIHILHFGWSS